MYTPAMSLLELRDVSKTFKTFASEVRAVREVSLRADAGEFICIHGPAGSGKSTLLNLVAGLETADSGEIRVEGRDVTLLDEEAWVLLRLRSVGLVYAADALVEEFTAAENVALPLEASGTPSSAALRQADEVLASVGLPGIGSRRPWQLRAGQRQRVCIARALAGGRRIVVADEPTGSLDGEEAADLFELLARVCRAGALAVVCSHSPLCQRYAGTVYEMVDGRLRAVLCQEPQ